MKAPHLSKKLIIGAGILAVLVIAALVVLLSVSNGIIKTQIEKALGKDASIERIALGWNKVEVFGITLSSEGQPFLRVKKIEVRASFFTVFGRHYVVSEVTVEQPSAVLDIDDKGSFMNPFGSPKEGQTKQGNSAPGRPLDVGRIVVSDGTVTIHDKQLKGPDTVNFDAVQFKLENISFPLSDSPAKFALQLAMGGPVASGTLKCNGTINVAAGSGTAVVALENLAAFPDGQGPRIKVGSIAFAASSKNGQSIVVSGLTMTKPFARLQADKAGRLENPLPLAGAKNEKEQPKSTVSIAFKNTNVTGGEVLYFDERIPRSQPIRVTDISLRADAFSFPLSDEKTAWQFSARIPDKTVAGQVSGDGSTNFLSLDTAGKMTLRNLDIVGLKPYLQKAGEADIQAGSLDMDMNVTIKKKSIYAPTHAVIKGLRLAPGSSAADKFLGVPRTMVIKLLQTSNDELPVDFVVEGSLDNPSFSLRENLMKRFTVGIAGKLGLSVVETGQNVIKGGGNVLKGIGKGLKGLFQ